MANTYKALSTVTVGAGGAASISFTNIPQTYTDLVVKTSFRSAGATNDTIITTNGLSGSNSSRVLYGGSGSTASFSSTSAINGLTISSSFTASSFTNGELYIPNYVSNANLKSSSLDDAQEQNVATSGSTYMYLGAGLFAGTAPITTLTITPGSGISFAQYSTATLYGVFNADVSSAPATPTIGTATATGTDTATVTFTGVSNAASYTATSTPGSITGTGTTSPITVSGLTSGTGYTFKVKSNNPFGSSAESAASNSITTLSASFESIATVNLTSGSAASITFSNIPSTYTHLQIRASYNFGGNGGTPRFRLGNGSADTGANYTFQQFQGNGSSVTAGNTTPGDSVYLGLGYERTDRQAFVMDILDYANTNKFKTYRFALGYAGSSGVISMNYGQWRSLSVLDYITFIVQLNNYSQYSHFALYGIKGA